MITKRHQTVTAIHGKHVNAEDSDNDVIMLRIIDQVVAYVPMNTSQHFPFLTVLKIWSSGLRSLNQEDIRDMKHLTDLSVSGNNIEKLNSNLFQFNQKLIKIDFTRNRLKHIGTNLLQPLKNLASADFYQNDCIHDGSRFLFEHLRKNLREKCQPTRKMMLEEVESLSKENESLITEIAYRQKQLDACEEEKNSHAKLDSLFPSILSDNLVWNYENK